MSSGDDELKQTAKSLALELYEVLIVGEIPERPSYRGLLSADKQFALDYEGYRRQYGDLYGHLFNFGEIDQHMSEDAIQDEIHALLLEFAEAKYGEPTRARIEQIAEEWINNLLEADYLEQQCYVPVVGLRPHASVTIGDIEFIPLDEAAHQIPGDFVESTLDRLTLHRDCIAKGTVTGEPKRAVELLRSRIEEVLNVLRYVGSLVWHNQPVRHIYIAGREPKRISYAFAVDPKGNTSRIGDAVNTPLPYEIDAEFLQYAQAYGFSYLNDLLSSETRTPLENALFVAIQWYGDAMQDLDLLFSFAKFYVSIETATKKRDEFSAKEHIPRRVSVLVRPFSREQQQRLEADIEAMIDERNAVFHSGRPEAASVEQLAWLSRLVAMNSLNNLRRLMEEQGISTKDELQQWAQDQHAKYLS